MSKREEERINPKLIPSASGNQNQNQNQSPQQPLSQIVISKPEDVKFLDDSLFHSLFLFNHLFYFYIMID